MLRRSRRRASRHKLVSSVLDSRQLNIHQLYQSIVATRVPNFRAIGMYVMSAANACLGAVLCTSRSRHGYDRVNLAASRHHCPTHWPS